MRLRPSIFALPVLFSCLLAAGCAGDTSATDPGASTGDEEDLTSLSALSRTIDFVGVVYLPTTASQDEIVTAVNAQCKTGFGPLRNAKAVPNTRELKNADPASFKKTEVEVIDTKNGGASSKMLRVSYRYKDAAIVDKGYASRSSVSVALLGKSQVQQSDRVYKECTDNSAHTREFPLWYEFNPTLSSCRDAIDAEQASLDAERQKLTNKKTQVTRDEVDRLYLPVNVKLGPNKTNKGNTYPEYHRLFSGGVEADKMVIGLVNGIIDDDAADITDDSGYTDWTDELAALIGARPFKIVGTDPPVDLSSFTTGSKTLKNPTIKDIVDLNNGQLKGYTVSEQKALKKLVGAKITHRWVTLEAPVSVKIGEGAAKNFTFKVQTYFGASSDASIHKRAIKTSDIFLYNGHSYIGSGPLDPTRFSKSDFPSSYQILFIDGCVSYNYYEKDYFPLKEGASKNLELITNGIEAPAFESGAALGEFMAAVLSGKQPSYLDLLTAAEATDSLRVVDGEVDNAYSPQKQPITITAR
jgi:hypothetical protein